MLMEDSGYRPLQLRLRGFKGLRSGLGCETLTLDLEALVGDASLVAIAGANGRGKTTVMDNLHPYLVMPSRAGADGFGAFSYYDHVFLPESEKELVWRHAGKTFKTHLVFRVNGKKKTEAFLFERADDKWCPVTLADGTVCDGKVETYERAVTAILGPQETFFTSVFSAQGKRPLSAFKNGEIKTLLADLLGLEAVRTQGSKAAEVVRLLKGGLGVIRQEEGQGAEALSRLQEQAVCLDGAASAVAGAKSVRAAASSVLEKARNSLAQATAAQQAAAGIESRRRALQADAQRIAHESHEAIARLDVEGQRLRRRETELAQRADNRRSAHASKRKDLAQQQDRLIQVVELAPFVKRASARLDLAQQVVGRRAALVKTAQRSADRLEALRATLRTLRESAKGIEREAGQLALRQADLDRRFGLARAVPCVGTDLQGRCQLLGDANEAKALLPTSDAALADLARRRSQVATETQDVQVEVGRLANAGELRNRAEVLLERARQRSEAYAITASRANEVHRAGLALAELSAQLGTLESGAPAETVEEASERVEIIAGQAQLALQRERVARDLQEGLDRVQAQTLELPAAFDVHRVEAARQALTEAEREAKVAEEAEIAAVQREEKSRSLRDRLVEAETSKRAIEARAARIESELSAWSLLAKCLSNDGVIALAIDDAGPTFSALANDLLLACYGPRFTLEVITQSATAKGELREDFDIIVHDGLRDESKSLKLVSGGERVWINECLTRAIALYLAGNTGRRYGTLFCDEADGPLDPDRKRRFMDMKREVLRLGGYQCEFYVSQTPELTAMADHVIDLDQLVVVADIREGN
jgi:DNA repair protein SbcC/Rad50